MPAIRTQVYFTEEQRRRLDLLAAQRGTTLAGVVRQAVDAYVHETPAPSLAAVLDDTFGSMPELETTLRDGWDRGYG